MHITEHALEILEISLVDDVDKRVIFGIKIETDLPWRAIN